MQHVDATDGLLDMLEWSEAVIFDSLHEAYRARGGEGAAAREFARRHCRAWRALIAGDIGEYEVRREDLVRALEGSGFGADCAAQADARTLMELNEIVAARFQRSPRLAREHRLALVALAARLAPTDRAA